MLLGRKNKNLDFNFNFVIGFLWNRIEINLVFFELEFYFFIKDER